MYLVKSQKGDVAIYQDSDGKIIFEYEGGKYVFNNVRNIYKEIKYTGEKVIIRDLFIPSYEFFTVIHNFFDNRNKDITSFFR